MGNIRTVSTIPRAQGLEPLDPNIASDLAKKLEVLAPKLGIRSSKNLPLKKIREALQRLGIKDIEINRGLLADATVTLSMAQQVAQTESTESEDLKELGFAVRSMAVKLFKELS